MILVNFVLYVILCNCIILFYLFILFYFYFFLHAALAENCGEKSVVGS